MRLRLGRGSGQLPETLRQLSERADRAEADEGDGAAVAELDDEGRPPADSLVGATADPDCNDVRERDLQEAELVPRAAAERQATRVEVEPPGAGEPVERPENGK